MLTLIQIRSFYGSTRLLTHHTDSPDWKL